MPSFETTINIRNAKNITAVLSSDKDTCSEQQSQDLRQENENTQTTLFGKLPGDTISKILWHLDTAAPPIHA